VYLLDEASDSLRRPGGASRWWLHQSLAALATSLRTLGGVLVLRRGAAVDQIPSVVQETGAVQVFWNRRYGGVERAVDEAVEAKLQSTGVAVSSYAAKLLHEPGSVRTQAGDAFRVFGPFWRATQAMEPVATPLPRPNGLNFAAAIQSDALSDWKLLPRRPDWSGGLVQTWTPGEAAAHSRLETFLRSSLAGYAADRDFPAWKQARAFLRIWRSVKSGHVRSGLRWIVWARQRPRT
jgi:deoxyribodipyrimidine photo-lyase